KGDVQKAAELLAAAACRSFDNVHGGGERGAACLRGEPVTLVVGEAFCDAVDLQRQLVALAPRMKPFVRGHGYQPTRPRPARCIILARGSTFDRDHPPPT